jgi:CheY-like chemotaxis protein
MSKVGVLVVEDFEPFRRFVCSTLKKNPELQVIGEVSDGLEAVQKAEELQPDLVVLDIGLPSLHGIEAARRILKRSISCEQRQFLFRDCEPRKAAIQADQELWEYQDAGIGKMFEAGEMDHHLGRKFLFIGRRAGTKHDTPPPTHLSKPKNVCLFKIDYSSQA